MTTPPAEVLTVLTANEKWPDQGSRAFKFAAFSQHTYDGGWGEGSYDRPARALRLAPTACWKDYR